MKKIQSGQALILTLILLAIGALIVFPMLNLTSNSLKNSPIITSREKSFYADDAAQEFVMWKLVYTSYSSNFTYDGQSNNFTVDVCGTPVKVSVVMRAMATWTGVTLIANTPIKPTANVTPTPVADASLRTYTYDINLEQISGNASQGLGAVYFILPDATTYDYVPGNSYLSVDGGAWQSFGDPLIESSPIWPASGPNFANNQVRLRWPNPSDPVYSDGPASGNFTSPTKDFVGGQVKEIRFNISMSGLPKEYNYGWVVLKPWTTLSGATANITVLNQSNYDNGLLNVSKSALPNFVPAGSATQISYTITIFNQQGSNDKILGITDYLPPGFSYVSGTTTGDFTTSDPTTTYGPVNGVNRWQLTWSPPSNKQGIASGQTLHHYFKAITSENVSGSYYNEVNTSSQNQPAKIFSTPGVSVNQTSFSTGYTWNSAPVIIPAYDSSTTSGNVTTNANLAITSGGTSASVYSFQIK